MRFAILLCLLSACTVPHAYRQAASPFAPPIEAEAEAEAFGEPHSGPGVGPSHYGPGQPHVQPPPKRQGTAYPAEERPVIRAADEFRKSTTSYSVSAILGPVPGLPRDVPDECAKKMTTALLEVFPTLLERDVHTSDSLCLDARLMDLCVDQWLGKRMDEVAAVIRLKMQQRVKAMCGRRYLDDPNEDVNVWFFPVRKALSKT